MISSVGSSNPGSCPGSRQRQPGGQGIGREPLHQRLVVTAAEMAAIEAQLFAAGMPVAALMEQVVERLTAWIAAHYPLETTPLVGVLVGPGHNGGDALGVARRLFQLGYGVQLGWLSDRLKPLTANHRDYAAFLSIPTVPVAALAQADVIIDGGFGFGLSRPLTGAIAATLNDLATALATHQVPVVAIDLPSGLDTDWGVPLGTALPATQTLCLGLWKRGLLQAAALPWIGEAVLIPFEIPQRAIAAVMGADPPVQRLTPGVALAHLPLDREATVHKYRTGHVLLVAGSRRYGGAALLAAQGAIASGVGMVTLVVPEELRLTALAQVPAALVIGAETTATGAISALPPDLDLAQYDVVACGPGLTLDSGVLAPLWASDRPLVWDADGLNWLAQGDAMAQLQQRPAPTLITPHLGEFRRLFPGLMPTDSPPRAGQENSPPGDQTAAALAAAQATGVVLVMKGARSGIASGEGRLWILPTSTPALARGGSGDVLTGLLGGLAAQHCQRGLPAPAALLSAAIGGVWWHAAAGAALAQERSVLGVNPATLATHLPQVLRQKAEG